MFTLSNAKSFTHTTLLILVLFIISYIFTYDALVIKHPNEPVRSYKDFLLKHTKGKRIIIESGSNAYHGIDSTTLEKTFNTLTINLSDNAGYPLEYKLKRIQRYAHAGDVVLLPLELSHYDYATIPKNFYDNIFTSLNSYYTSLGILDKLKLMATTPFSSFFSRLTERNVTSFDPNKYLFAQASKFLYGDRGDAEGGIIKKNDSCGKSCKNLYFHPSEKFMENLQLLTRIKKEKNIQFVFTPPVSIINKQYKDTCDSHLQHYNDEIKAFMHSHHLPFIGNIQENIYSEKYMKDTCHHLIAEGRDLHTKVLIEHIKKSPYVRYFNHHTSMQYPLDFDINKTMQHLEPNQKVELATDTEHILLLKGWYTKEAWGVWSRGNESTLSLKLPDSLLHKEIQLTFDTNHFAKADTTQLFINDTYLGAYPFSGITTIKVPKSIYKKTEGILKITFKYTNVTSPHELNHHNSDDRKLKMGLKSILLQAI